MEFFIKPDDINIKKIRTLCCPFDFSSIVQNEILKHNTNNSVMRLFLLTDPDTIKNNFKESDDFLAFALCKDEKLRTNLQYFEVNAKFRHSYEPHQKYRRVGTSAVNALKNIYQTRELYGQSALHALKFWIKNGFFSSNKNNQNVHWCQR